MPFASTVRCEAALMACAWIGLDWQTASPISAPSPAMNSRRSIDNPPQYLTQGARGTHRGDIKAIPVSAPLIGPRCRLVALRDGRHLDRPPSLLGRCGNGP